jgi:hypothetical protein
VGSFTFGASGLDIIPLAERSTELGWEVLPTPRLAGHTALDGGSWLAGVSCTSSSACTAVGQSATPDYFTPLVERWDGLHWVLQSTPRLPGSSDFYPGGVLNDVACISGSHCIAVGFTRNVSLVEQWNGSSWRIQNTPTPPASQDAVLNAVACPTSMTCVAVGSYTPNGSQTFPLAERWNGTSWSIEAAPGSGSDSSLVGVSCTSPSACFAVGSSKAGSVSYTQLLERWDGAAWTVLPPPTEAGITDTSLSGVACASASACVVVGHSASGALTERLDGSAWTIDATPSLPVIGLLGVSCSSQSACTAVGGDAENDSTAPFAESSG